MDLARIRSPKVETMGPDAAAISSLRGGAVGFRRPSSLPPYFTVLKQPYECRQRMLTFGQRRIKMCRLRARLNAKPTSEWDVEPYTYEEGGGKYHLNELDVASFLDPPKELIPLDPGSYNPASYIWKKIEDIPEERRHHLLTLLNPRLILRAWEAAGRRYDDAKLSKKTASTLLPDGNSPGSLELWNCRTSAAPLRIAWFNSSQKAIFSCTDGKTYGRIIGGYNLLGIFNFSSPPLYFTVRHVNEVMATEQPCDLAYEFGDGLLNLPEYPQGFPRPAKHSWPFNDQVVIYVRNLGPGVLVGQAWQEGKSLQQVPKKLCGEILMVKDYSAPSTP